ncbi:MAG: YgiQ family radical SAM protein [Proteobacteria bacterium]|nr:YgiQ family radical SAM protein [Pseudomonadota bacterium]
MSAYGVTDRPGPPAPAPPRDRGLGTSYRKHWAKRFGVAPQLPVSRAEMEALGWDACDIVLVTGDAYVDHPSFGMALIGRLLEAQGFRVGILAQPRWQSAEDFARLGPPRLFFGVTGGNMDSMVNRYTSDRRIRSNDAYTPEGAPHARPDRCVLVYAQRCREAFPEVPIVLGGIEASLRRVAHYDYWSDKVRRSVLLDAKADLLVYGNGERAVVAIAHRLAAGEPVGALTNLRGTAFVRGALPADWTVIDATRVDEPGERAAPGVASALGAEGARSVLRLPSYEQVRDDRVLYAHASRTLHRETNPGNARALVQAHGDRLLWLNPPPLPLTTKEMDGVYGLPYSRRPHLSYGQAKIPAFEMIQHSVTIMRGCFGGCSFCSITEHEGRVIQSRSEASILREIEAIRDSSPAFTGVISDLGGPTANMYRLGCKDPAIEASCRRPSCVYPVICKNLDTDHSALIGLYRKARALPGVKKVLVASGLRYDLAVRSPEYVRELAAHHVGGYLKIAPEHTEAGPLSKMMKPGIGSYDRFKELFDRYSQQAGKEQYLIPYFIAAHPGTTDEDMLALALWLKRNGFRADQVQAFLPSPMASATAMYHSGKDPLHPVRRASPEVSVPKSLKQRRLHKAFLRYHDPENWPLLREALVRLGRADLIGKAKHCLVPLRQPPGTGNAGEGRRRTPGATRFKTQHTGLPVTPGPPVTRGRGRGRS